MLEIKSIWDLLSMTVLITHPYALYEFLVFLKSDMLIGLSVVQMFEKFGKYMTKSLYDPIFKRPDAANNCNLLNSGGKCGHLCGFPSGHTSSITFFMNALMFRNHSEITLETFVKYNILPFLVGVSRYMKSCHNMIQIVCGYLLALVISLMLYRTNYRITYQQDDTNKEKFTRSTPNPKT